MIRKATLSLAAFVAMLVVFATTSGPVAGQGGGGTIVGHVRYMGPTPANPLPRTIANDGETLGHSFRISEAVCSADNGLCIASIVRRKRTNERPKCWFQGFTVLKNCRSPLVG